MAERPGPFFWLSDARSIAGKAEGQRMRLTMEEAGGWGAGGDGGWAWAGLVGGWRLCSTHSLRESTHTHTFRDAWREA